MQVRAMCVVCLTGTNKCEPGLSRLMHDDLQWLTVRACRDGPSLSPAAGSKIPLCGLIVNLPGVVNCLFHARVRHSTFGSRAVSITVR